MEELLQNSTVIEDLMWEFGVRGAFVCFAVLYAAVTRNLSDSIDIVEKLDNIAIGLFIIGAFPVLAVLGVYKGINYLIKNRNEKRCFRFHTEGSFVHSFKIIQRGDEHLMVNRYETFVEYYWDEQNGFCEKVTSVGYEKVFLAPKNSWKEIYREESIDINFEDEIMRERERGHRYERVSLKVKQY